MNYRRLVCGVCVTGVVLANPVLSQNTRRPVEPAQTDQPVSKRQAQTHDVTELTAQLDSPDLTVRLQALAELSKLGPKAAPATDALIRTLGDVRMDLNTRQRVCNEAAAVLKGIGPSAVDLVVKKMKVTNSPGEYHTYALAIHNFGTDAKDAAGFLIEQLATAKGPKAAITMHALNTLGEAAVPAIPLCVEALNADSFHTRCMACDTLGALAKWQRPPDPGLKRILELLNTGVGSSRRHAAMCLGQIGIVDGFDIVAALTKSTEDRQDSVRNDALRALVQIGPPAGAALPHLKQLMAKPDYRNRVNAARSVWLISGQAADSVSTLQQLTVSQDTNLEAIDVLAEMQSAARTAIPKLIDFLDSPDPDLRMQAVRAIGLIGSADASVHQAVRKAQNDADPDVATAALQAIDRLNTSKNGK